MERIEVFKAFDGAMFPDERACKDYEINERCRMVEFLRGHAYRVTRGNDVAFLGCELFLEDEFFALQMNYDKNIYNAVVKLFGTGVNQPSIDKAWNENLGIIFRRYDEDDRSVYYYGTFDDCLAEVKDTLNVLFTR